MTWFKLALPVISPVSHFTISLYRNTCLTTTQRTYTVVRNRNGLSKRMGEMLPVETTSKNIVVLVHVKQRCIPVSCGDGTQSARWLANVGMVRHDDFLGRSLGAPAGLKLGSGRMVPLQQSLNDAGIQDGHHVWVVLRGAARPAWEELLFQNSFIWVTLAGQGGGES